jgi:uncharacterized membrane protein YeaQ/YmgE (transglycosylase-associated protein family)
MGVLLWVIVIGFVAGVIARLVMPGPNTPKGFVVTTIIGVAGALLATVVGDLVGLYRPGQGAGLIGATIGALVILFIWNRLVAAQVSAVNLSIRSSAENGRRPARASARDYIRGRPRPCANRRLANF